MATEASFHIFSIDSGSLAILFSLASISVVRVLGSASNAAFLAFFSSSAGYNLVSNFIWFCIWACKSFTDFLVVAFLCSRAGWEDRFFKACFTATK
jgi:predicted GNAT superfamily acetyltransferase